MIIDLYSKQQRRARGNQPDVYTYDNLPRTLRVQIVHVLSELFRNQDHIPRVLPFDAAAKAHALLCKEYGLFSLSESRTLEGKIWDFVQSTPDVEQVLDVIQVSLLVARSSSRFKRGAADAAQAELNGRFREHAVGFEFAGATIVRVDSQHLHQEAVQPALQVLAEPRFSAANDEYRRAHDHYMHKRHEEAIADCLKTFESVLKVIIAGRKWPHQPTDTAKALLDVAFANSLVPAYLQSEFAGLRSILEGGVPTTRNKTSGHGAGATPRVVPAHLVAYVLHLTASSILFLAECDRHYVRP